MAATSATQTAKTEAGELQEQARRHLWMHFTRMGSFDAEHEVPIIVRGEGCYVWDEHGNRYLDGLSALFCVNSGHGRTELGDAMAAQVRELDFITVWSYAHPRAIELATRIASLAPGDLNRVFFTNSGSEAVESAIKLSRSYHRARGNGQKTKLIAREIAYHGTTLGALSATGIPALRSNFEPLAPGGIHVPNTNSYRWPADRDPLWAADQIEEAIEFEGPETVAAVILEPLQNAGGCIPPQPGYFQRVREICDRYDVLLISDEVICAWGRLGHWFGCQRYGYQPDIITVAKALTSAYVPMAALTVPEVMYQAMLDEARKIGSFGHGFTYSGHPVAAAVALKALEIYERERLVEKVAKMTPQFQARLAKLAAHPLVGEARGYGLVGAVELVADKATKRSFDPKAGVGPRAVSYAEGEGLLLRFLAGDVLSICPPLVITPQEIDELFDRLARALDRTLDWARREGLLKA
jgi:adenosylmethionine-8-amino-7-oxononanoate aminotransferase